MPLIQLRRGTTTDWAAADPILAEGEVGVDLTTGYLKVGNGTDPWSTLPYRGGPAGPSAYDLAVAGGFVGTEQQWLDSLVSTVPGPPGPGLEINGTATSYAQLPTTGLTAGDTYIALDTGLLYVWTGSAWPAEQDGITLQGPPGSTHWDDLAGKPAVIAAGANAAEARAAIGAPAIGTAATDAMAGNRIQLVASLPGTPAAGVLYLIPKA